MVKTGINLDDSLRKDLNNGSFSVPKLHRKLGAKEDTHDVA